MGHKGAFGAGIISGFWVTSRHSVKCKREVKSSRCQKPSVQVLELQFSPFSACNREEQIWLHSGSVCFTLTFVFYCFCCLSLKYTKQPILRALTFKGITLFHLYRDKKVAEQTIIFVLLEVYRNIMTWPTWTAARTKDSCTKVRNNQPHPSCTMPLKVPCWNPLGVCGMSHPSPCVALQ